jgi:hypothetical protein
MPLLFFSSFMQRFISCPTKFPQYRRPFLKPAHIPEEELETMRERSEGDVYYAAIGRIATEWATFEHISK